MFRRRSGGRRACRDSPIIRYRLGGSWSGSEDVWRQSVACQSTRVVRKQKQLLKHLNTEISESHESEHPSHSDMSLFFFFSVFLFSGCFCLWMLGCILLDGLSSCHRLLSDYCFVFILSRHLLSVCLLHCSHARQVFTVENLSVLVFYMISLNNSQSADYCVYLTIWENKNKSTKTFLCKMNPSESLKRCEKKRLK